MVANKKNRKNEEGEVMKVKRAKYDSLCIYEINETELEILEKGSPDSLFLNFSIFLISSAISFTLTLTTTTIDNVKIFNTYLFFTILSYLIGIILFIIWFRTKISTKSIIQKIKNRLSPDGKK